ncbi:MAG TPA: hypothetical protein VM869_35720 [Enhygromyxa sp.]|nr:hypothetical protein [Enhygromyxa sp.]
MSNQGTFEWAIEQVRAGKCVRRRCWPWCFYMQPSNTECVMMWRAIIERLPWAYDPERVRAPMFEHNIGQAVMLSDDGTAPGDSIWRSATDWEVAAPTWIGMEPGADPDFLAFIPAVGVWGFKGAPPLDLGDPLPFYGPVPLGS